MQATVNEGVKRRHRLNEQAWLEAFKRFEGAGLTVEAFCRREGLCRSSFARWRSRLLGGAGVHRQLKHDAQSQAPVAFVDLGTLGSGAPAPCPVLELRLDLGAGLTLTLVRR